MEDPRSSGMEGWEGKRGHRDVGISVRGHSELDDQVLVAAAFFSGRERPIDASQRRYPSVTVPAGPRTARTARTAPLVAHIPLFLLILPPGIKRKPDLPLLLRSSFTLFSFLSVREANSVL